MTKREFLDSLRRALNGNMESAAVEDNIRFYESWFASETAKGSSEAELTAQLGDPRILARTLIDAAERAGDSYAREANETQYGGNTARSEEKNFRSGRGGFTGGSSGNRQTENEAGDESLRLPGWLVALVLILVLTVVIGIVGTLIWAILPYLFVGLFILWVVRVSRRR